MAKSKRFSNKGVKIIKKSNQLIEAQYRFDIWETRIFLSVLAQIRMEDVEFQPYRIWYKDVIKIFDIKSHQSYSLLRQAARSLMGKTFNVSYKDDNGFQREKEYHIIRTVDFLSADQTPGLDIESQEYIDIQIESEMKPLLLELHQNFTKYDLRNVAKLGSQPVRLYELLKQHETFGNRKLTLEYLRWVLEFDKEYPAFADFFRYFVTPAVNEINANTDITIHKVDKIKQGRNVVAIHFFFKKKSDQELMQIRGESVQQLPLFSSEQLEPDVLPQPKAAPVAASSPATNGFFEKLNDWWGVQKTEFDKRVAGKTDEEIEIAIEYTKTKIREGKAQNPAGVFLDAIAQSRRTVDQIRTEKRKKTEDQRKRLITLHAELQTLSDEYTAAINQEIREITTENPGATETAIDRIKAEYTAIGDRSILNKTIEDFRNDPVLRRQVKTAMVRLFPARFEAIHIKYQSSMKALEDEIAMLKK